MMEFKREEIEALKFILEETRAKVCKAAMTGFNYADKSEGDWCEELFVNNGALTSAIKKLEAKLKEME